MIATASAVAFVVFSCKGKLGQTDMKLLEETPLQVVDGMLVVHSENGDMQMRMEAAVMQRFENDSLSYEFFPEGFDVFAYTDGLLETHIRSDKAKHLNFKDGRESWEAFGNVVIKNLIKNEVMETDTLYWDQKNEKLYTHCYVKLYSPSGLMQGYGMESDQKARNSIIYHPFNSYGIVVKDTTEVLIDSINFIGPLLK